MIPIRIGTDIKTDLPHFLEDFVEVVSKTFQSFDEHRLELAKRIRLKPTSHALAKTWFIKTQFLSKCDLNHPSCMCKKDVTQTPMMCR